MIKFNFVPKDGNKCQWTSDPWYDLTNGYIVPEELLVSGAQAERVRDAAKLIEAFFDQAFECGTLQEA